jgi:hypothetical protein
MRAQDLDADRVERAEPRHALDRAANERADALLHLARGLVGEGDGQDLTWPLHALCRQDVGDPRCQNPRLAGARASEHEDRPLCGLDRAALFRVQAIEIARQLMAP